MSNSTVKSRIQLFQQQSTGNELSNQTFGLTFSNKSVVNNTTCSTTTTGTTEHEHSSDSNNLKNCTNKSVNNFAENINNIYIPTSSSNSNTDSTSSSITVTHNSSTSDSQAPISILKQSKEVFNKDIDCLMTNGLNSRKSLQNTNSNTADTADNLILDQNTYIKPPLPIKKTSLSLNLSCGSLSSASSSSSSSSTSSISSNSKNSSFSTIVSNPEQNKFDSPSPPLKIRQNWGTISTSVGQRNNSTINSSSTSVDRDLYPCNTLGRNRRKSSGSSSNSSLNSYNNFLEYNNSSTEEPTYGRIHNHNNSSIINHSLPRDKPRTPTSPPKNIISGIPIPKLSSASSLSNLSICGKFNNNYSLHNYNHHQAPGKMMRNHSNGSMAINNRSATPNAGLSSSPFNGYRSNTTSTSTNINGNGGQKRNLEQIWNKNSGSSNSKFYDSIGWKEKYEESEKKRLHVVTLAQKATRDYEELRRRYSELNNEHEKLSNKFESATYNLDKLRKASESVYDDYYKLKRKYEAENVSKSEALLRVDQYNRENRRLKRQSALIMQQIGDNVGHMPIIEVPETESGDSDKEIEFLRKRVQELESKVVDLEGELEKTKLSEFETQESIMMLTDSVSVSRGENTKLKEQLKLLQDENRKCRQNIEDSVTEIDALKSKNEVDQEKLKVAEEQLRKLSTERNILNRQSLVFMSDALNDNRLMDALNQISDLQTSLEEQKEEYERQIVNLENRISELEMKDEETNLRHDAQVKALEEQLATIKMSKKKVSHHMETNLDDYDHYSNDNDTCTSSNQNGIVQQTCPPTAPPPPPPLPNFQISGNIAGNTPKSDLNSMINSGFNSLQRRPLNVNGSCNRISNGNGNGDDESSQNGPKSLPGSAHIDDVVSQIKKGIKLRPMDKGLSNRKTSESPEKTQESSSIEEMRNILNNMKKIRRLE